MTVNPVPINKVSEGLYTRQARIPPGRARPFLAQTQIATYNTIPKCSKIGRIDAHTAHTISQQPEPIKHYSSSDDCIFTLRRSTALPYYRMTSCTALSRCYGDMILLPSRISQCGASIGASSTLSDRMETSFGLPPTIPALIELRASCDRFRVYNNMRLLNLHAGKHVFSCHGSRIHELRHAHR